MKVLNKNKKITIIYKLSAILAFLLAMFLIWYFFINNNRKDAHNGNDIKTTSTESTAQQDFVTNEEVEAFINVLNQHNIKFTIYDDLKDAIVNVLKGAKLNDIIILGGAQGMDLGAKIALEWLQENLLFQLNS